MSFPRYPKYKASGLGCVGYEIPFNRHFYVFQPPRTLSAIDTDLKASTDRILTMRMRMTFGWSVVHLTAQNPGQGSAHFTDLLLLGIKLAKL